MVDRDTRRLCHQQELVILENRREVGRDPRFGVVFHVVDYLVATMRDGLDTGNLAVQRHEPPRQAVDPIDAAVVSKALAQRIQQEASILFRTDFALEEHIRRGFLVLHNLIVQEPPSYSSLERTYPEESRAPSSTSKASAPITAPSLNAVSTRYLPAGAFVFLL